MDRTLGYLLVLFVWMKLTHQIEWSWWQVLAPVWINTILTIAAEVLKEREIAKKQDLIRRMMQKPLTPEDKN